MCHLADHEESLADQCWSMDHTLTNTDLEPSALSRMLASGPDAASRVTGLF